MRISLALVLLLWPTLGYATVLSDWSLEEQLSHADRVVIGTVEKQRTVVVDGTPLRESTIRVEQVLRGRVTQRVVLTQYGGRRGKHRVRLAGDAELHAGDRALFVLRRSKDGRDYLVGMSLGVFRLREGELWQRIEVPRWNQTKQELEPPGERRFTIEDLLEAL